MEHPSNQYEHGTQIIPQSTFNIQLALSSSLSESIMEIGLVGGHPPSLSLYDIIALHLTDIKSHQIKSLPTRSGRFRAGRELKYPVQK